MPRTAASSGSAWSSRNPRSIKASPRETLAEDPRQAGDPGAASGRQRRQGRKPAASAAAAEGKNRTFSERAGLTGQIGRQ